MRNLRKSENLAVLVQYIDCELVRLDGVVWMGLIGSSGVPRLCTGVTPVLQEDPG